MKKIPLTKGKFALVDDEDYVNLTEISWQYASGYAQSIQRKKGGKQYAIMMHRKIMNCPSGLVVDHINHDTLDNRKSNLRICTRSENLGNRFGKKNGTSKYKGVTWHKASKKWSVAFNKKWIGAFSDEVEAARVYDKCAIEHYGRFAKLNFPE